MNEKQQRQEFADRRNRGIGGSDVAPILGVGKFRTAWDVLADKRGLRPRNPNEQEADHLLIGRLMEPVVAALYEAKQGRTLVMPPGFIPHPEHSFLVANPDRFVENERRGAEIKTCGLWGRSDWGEPGTDEVPADYLMQTVHYMAVTGFDVWDVPVLFHGSRFACYVVQRDRDLERWVIDRLQTWWQRHVVEGWDLPLDGSPACAEFVALRYPENTRPLQPASPDAIEAAQRLAHLRKQLDLIQTQATELENRIKDEIGDAEGIEWPTGKVTWKRSKDAEMTDWQGVAKHALQGRSDDEIAALLAAHKKIRAGSRRFLLNVKEDKQ